MNNPDPLPGLQDNTEVLHRITDRLTERFAGVIAAETVERYVFESYAALVRTARISTFLPSTTEHFANDRLSALARSKGAAGGEGPEVLFVCVQNAVFSQMAAALLDLEGGGRVRARSAGSMPAPEIDPAVVAVMSELGIDVSENYPKPLTDDVVRASDVVITLDCRDSCPVYPGKRYENWSVGEPAGGSVESFRAVRDRLHSQVKTLVSSLAG